VITVAVRWYLRYGLSYRDMEELLAERGVEVDHVVKSAGVVCDGWRVIFWVGQALSAGKVTSWLSTVVSTGRSRQRVRTSSPR
jgi:hypothetical protein